ncbi:MAG: hypothetical protein JST42_10905 [Bacteroidetes bacterium]|nr:hypothetical protein [Bacteroidota bacterium]
MGLIYKVIRNDYEIGEISDLSQDMWYIEGKWTPFHTYLSIEFEEKLKTFDPEMMVQNPENGLEVVLQNIAIPSEKLYCFATFFDGKILSLRQVTSNEALEKFFPNRE